MQQDKVFQQVYIPRSLQELSHVEIDRQQKSGQETFYEALTGLQNVKSEEQEYKNREYFENNVLAKGGEDSKDNEIEDEVDSDDQESEE